MVDRTVDSDGIYLIIVLKLIKIHCFLIIILSCIVVVRIVSDFRLMYGEIESIFFSSVCHNNSLK